MPSQRGDSNKAFSTKAAAVVSDAQDLAFSAKEDSEVECNKLEAQWCTDINLNVSP